MDLSMENVKKYNELTQEEKKAICNGCGGKGSFVPVPNFRFKASCNHHDYNYFLGGTEKDRLKADTQFLEAMILDAGLNGNLFRRIFYKFWAYIYYFAVRIFGKKYFNYND